MDRQQVFDMLKDEMAGKLDADTIGKLQNSKSSKEALSILEGASITLSDDMLSAISGGATDPWSKPCSNLCLLYS